MNQQLRASIEANLEQAQREIQGTLQHVHDATGLIPNMVEFDCIDTRTVDDCEKRNCILVSNVRIKANT